MIPQTRNQLLKLLYTQFISTLHPDSVGDVYATGHIGVTSATTLDSGSHNHENCPFSIACLCTIVIVDPDNTFLPTLSRGGASARVWATLYRCTRPSLSLHTGIHTSRGTVTGIRLSARTAYHLPEQVSFASLRRSFVRWVFFTPI